MQREKWDGATISKDVAAHVFGADEVHYMHEVRQGYDRQLVAVRLRLMIACRRSLPVCKYADHKLT